MMLPKPGDLIDNAGLFGREAVEHYLVRDETTAYDWRFVSLFAATSIEQYLKALLVAANPLLIASDETALLALAGATTSTARRIRTITPPTALARSSAFVPRLGSLNDRLLRLFDIRNGVVHLVEEEPEDFAALFDAYLRATQLVGEHLEVDPEGFWLELDPLVRARLGERAATLEREVEEKVKIAAVFYETKYRGLSESERSLLRERSAIGADPWSRLLTGSAIEIQVECPACGSSSLVGAGVDVEWELEDWEWRGRVGLTPYFFACPVCNLRLEDEEVEWAGIEPEVPDDFDPSDFSEPPDWSDVPGYSDDDLHPPPPPA